MQLPLAIGLGGFLGALARHALTGLVPHRPGELFPLGTLVVNVLGSFLMGLVMAWLHKHAEMSAATRLFVTSGLLGSFTTFSTLAYECVALGQNGRLGGALACLGANVLIGFVALGLGFNLGGR